MHWLEVFLSGVGAALLPVSTVLLLEELTYGGLVRLLLALRPSAGKLASPKNERGGGR